MRYGLGKRGRMEGQSEGYRGGKGENIQLACHTRTRIMGIGLRGV